MYGKKYKRSILKDSTRIVKNSSFDSSPEKSLQPSVIFSAVPIEKDQIKKDEIGSFSLKEVSPIQPLVKKRRKQRVKKEEEGTSFGLGYSEINKNNTFLKNQNSEPVVTKVKAAIMNHSKGSKTTNIEPVPSQDPWILLDSITKSPSKIKKSPISIKVIEDKPNLSKKSKVVRKLQLTKLDNKEEKAWDFIEELNTIIESSTNSPSSKRKSNKNGNDNMKTKINFDIDLNFEDSILLDDSSVSNCERSYTNDNKSSFLMSSFLDNAVIKESRKDDLELSKINAPRKGDKMACTYGSMRTYRLGQDDMEGLDQEEEKRVEGNNDQEEEENNSNDEKEEDFSDEKEMHQNVSKDRHLRESRYKNDTIPKTLGSFRGSISNLKFQGTQIQYEDDLHFLLENLSPKSKSMSKSSKMESKFSDLVELAIKLHEDPQFLQFSKINGILEIVTACEGLIKDFIDDSYVCFMIGFILAVISDGQGRPSTLPILDFNGNHSLIELVEKLIGLNEEDFKPAISHRNNRKSDKIKETTLQIFKKFRGILGSSYTGAFIGISLLCSNGFFLNKGLCHSTLKYLNTVDLENWKNVSAINLLLILFEKCIIDLEPESFVEGLIPVSIKLLSLNWDHLIPLKILAIKILIMLTSESTTSHSFFNHNHKISRIVDILMTSSKEKSSELQPLLFGLLFNLLEASSQAIEQAQNSLYKIIPTSSSISEESMPFYSLVVGVLYSHNKELVRKVFDNTELRTIKLSLRRCFESKNLIMGTYRRIEQVLETLDV